MLSIAGAWGVGYGAAVVVGVACVGQEFGPSRHGGRSECVQQAAYRRWGARQSTSAGDSGGSASFPSRDHDDLSQACRRRRSPLRRELRQGAACGRWSRGADEDLGVSYFGCGGRSGRTCPGERFALGADAPPSRQRRWSAIRASGRGASPSGRLRSPAGAP